MLRRIAFLGLVAAAACSSKTSDKPGGALPPTLTADQKAEVAAIEAERAASAGMTAEAFAARYAVPHLAKVPYDALAATGLELLSKSSLALNDAEKTALGKNGFVISDREKFPTFTYGYISIYSQDLPLYVSADSLLEAVHRSYDAILKDLEQEVLLRSLQEMLNGMRTRLASDTAIRPSVKADLDVYLAVAKSLLQTELAPPVAGGDAAVIASIVEKAKAASGMETIRFFGTERDEDFSQFAPRGHYKGTVALENYFRATMWLGREDLRLLETMPDHTSRVNRAQVEGTLAFARLMGDPERAFWKTIADTVGVFVGETDAMTPVQIDAFAKDLGVSAPDVSALSDEKIRDVIVAGKYGAQRIASHYMVNGLGQGTMPLSSVFLVLGQRYVVDSHVFSNVVWDRVTHPGAPNRMMPNPLDVAFAALKNDDAAPLLADGLKTYAYAPDLHMMRFLVDKHPASTWDASLYGLWMSSLRALSPNGEIAKAKEVGLPSVATTEAWGRRVLNAQLASWAELRHDTLLYAKQSYTGSAGCVFPDAYVDPYPELYARLAAYASKGRELVASLGTNPMLGRITAHFDNLEKASNLLKGMAENERKGLALTTEQMAFINQAVKMEAAGCTSAPNGWYVQLHYEREESPVKLAPTIADVHTQPTDEAGNLVGKVLHVGTGIPRLMVVTVDNCTGSHAYVGLASSYFETVTQDFKRLDDQAWSTGFPAVSPADVPWMKDIVVR